jgi:hypothetical protein
MKVSLIKQITENGHLMKEITNLNQLYYTGNFGDKLPDYDIALVIETSGDEIIEVEGSRVLVKNKKWKEPINTDSVRVVPWIK